MGRKAIATKEAVYTAANLLSAAGRNITAAAVRDSIGGGGLSTIQSHIQNWRLKQDDTTADSGFAYTLPRTLHESFEQLEGDLNALKKVLHVYHQQESNQCWTSQLEELNRQLSLKDKKIEELEGYIQSLQADQKMSSSNHDVTAGKVSRNQNTNSEIYSAAKKPQNNEPNDDGQGSLFDLHSDKRGGFTSDFERG
jgi:chromosome segregation ATPase